MINNKHILIYILFCAVTITIFCSYHGGAANGNLGNMTGSPGAGNCGNCHNGGTDTTFSTIVIRKKGDTTNSSIKHYTANSLYTITVRGKHSQYDMFGFQTVVLDHNNNPVGNFANFDNYSHGHPAVNPVYAENNTRISKDTNGWFEVNFGWKAPNMSSGELILYGIVNAVNNNGQPSFDKTGQTMAIHLTDSTPVNISYLHLKSNVLTYPNPADKLLTIVLPKNENLKLLQLLSFDGGAVIKNIIPQQASSNNVYYINTDKLLAGRYILRTVYHNTTLMNTIIIKH